jgi:nicotinamide mononucleotide transporter
VETLTIVELVATSTSIICVWLTIRRHILSWAIGIVGIIAFMYVFYSVNLYGDMFLQFVYLAQSIYGWWYWQKYNNAELKLKGEQARLQVDALAPLDDTQNLDQQPSTDIETGIHHAQHDEIIYTVLFASITFGAMLAILVHGVKGAEYPFWDTTATTISLVANIWLARKIIETWFLWIVADIILIGLFTAKALYFSAATYGLFLIMAVLGYIEWRKGMKSEASEASQREG